MVPSSGILPERHFGYVCCKCQSVEFPGRRYGCWVCRNYNLCGSCYDSNDHPMLAGHMYYHPFDVHFTRLEYELYFGGEVYGDPTVAQSYKCAMCDGSGFTSSQLYEHLLNAHRTHDDCVNYCQVLHFRIMTEASEATAEADARNDSAGIPLAELRDVMRRSQLCHASLLEQQVRNLRDELRVINLGDPRNNARPMRGLLQREQRQPHDLQQQELLLREQVHEAKMNRFVRVNPTPMRWSLSTPKSTNLAAAARQHDIDNWDTDYANSSSSSMDEQRRLMLQQFRLDCLGPSFAAVLGGRITEIPANKEKREKEKEKRAKAKKEKAKETLENDANAHKFLCAQFLTEKVESKQPQEKLLKPERPLFVEALLCSMLNDEQLREVKLESPPPVLPAKSKVSNSNEAKTEPVSIEDPGTSGPPLPKGLDLFYRGLDVYKKWLVKFTDKKMALHLNPAALPSMILPTIREHNMLVDSDLDADTDGREEEGDEVAIDPPPKAVVFTINVVPASEIPQNFEDEPDIVIEDDDAESGEVDEEDDDNWDSETYDFMEHRDV